MPKTVLGVEAGWKPKITGQFVAPQNSTRYMGGAYSPAHLLCARPDIRTYNSQLPSPVSICKTRLSAYMNLTRQCMGVALVLKMRNLRPVWGESAVVGHTPRKGWREFKPRRCGSPRPPCPTSLISLAPHVSPLSPPPLVHLCVCPRSMCRVLVCVPVRVSCPVTSSGCQHLVLCE